LEYEIFGFSFGADDEARALDIGATLNAIMVVAIKATTAGFFIFSSDAPASVQPLLAAAQRRRDLRARHPNIGHRRTTYCFLQIPSTASSPRPKATQGERRKA
jgi:hypothetical protein